MQHVEAALHPVARDDVAERVRLGVTHVQVARGVREHVEHVLARPRSSSGRPARNGASSSQTGSQRSWIASKSYAAGSDVPSGFLWVIAVIVALVSSPSGHDENPGAGGASHRWCLSGRSGPVRLGEEASGPHAPSVSDHPRAPGAAATAGVRILAYRLRDQRRVTTLSSVSRPAIPGVPRCSKECFMRVSRTNLGVGTAAVGVAALLISTLLPAAQASSGSGGSSGAPPGTSGSRTRRTPRQPGSRTSAAPTPVLRSASRSR